MKIAIPTYNRPELKVYKLACSIVGEENVFIFFHNEEDSKNYPPVKNKIITNTDKGVAIARNSILNYFEQNEHIVPINTSMEYLFRQNWMKITILYTNITTKRRKFKRK